MSATTVTPIAQVSSMQVSSIRVAPTGRPASTGQVRLTRRGRLVVLAAALLLALVVSVALGGGSMASEEAGEPRATEIVVVNEGDTLWGIAAEVASDGEVRSMVHEIRELNNLESSVVALGQRLHVPSQG
ncbi:LysM peptidoglycan-binding domain-containing protein [Nocardioides sp. Y6]|uniref:LysM peptidoglycan-binding domain-containing protein n=1 Tax=Nocardioides malaquae TaxID=2773426 RepID=A0ABR9RVA9_9ACTN|nr:LysM peptidoglycan-binding domain-containing protein [Nocardioides malaquae]MBE7325295.1 LysM peptidoglycan-binding domain-containing protein [Nocardioides malaquae]